MKHQGLLRWGWMTGNTLNINILQKFYKCLRILKKNKRRHFWTLKRFNFITFHVGEMCRWFLWLQLFFIPFWMKYLLASQSGSQGDASHNNKNIASTFWSFDCWDSLGQQEVKSHLLFFLFFWIFMQTLWMSASLVKSIKKRLWNGNHVSLCFYEGVNSGTVCTNCLIFDSLGSIIHIS